MKLKFASGQGPDIFTCGAGHQAQNLVDAGYVRDLSTFYQLGKFKKEIADSYSFDYDALNKQGTVEFGKGVFRTVFYLPALFSTIVVAFLWSYVYAPYYGMISEVLNALGQAAVPNLLGTKATALLAVAFVETWKTSGTMTIIYLGGFKSFDYVFALTGRGPGSNCLGGTKKSIVLSGFSACGNASSKLLPFVHMQLLE